MEAINHSRRRFLSGGRRPLEPTTRIGMACFAARGIVCQSCGDACPEAAISFHPRAGAPALPIVAAARCNGCGACAAACPADAITVSPRNNEAYDV